jgi:hypothetical protein
MPFSIRAFRRFPVAFFVTYDAGPFQGQSTIWNISCTEWATDRYAGNSGTVVERAGEVIPTTPR